MLIQVTNQRPQSFYKYNGIISKEQGQDLNEYIAQMRNEWNSI